MTLSFFFGPLHLATILLAQQSFAADEATIGLLFGLSSIGGLLGSQLLGRAVDPVGHPLDNGGSLAEAPHRPIYRPATAIAPPMLATGLKIVDLFAPLKRGGHNGSIWQERWHKSKQRRKPYAATVR